MLSRLKGIETLATAHQRWSRWLTLDMLSRLKGIETRFSNATWISIYALDMLSRLKGIETKAVQWRVCHSHFGYAFPFEGNWNVFWPGVVVPPLLSLDMLSRLKGIETFIALSYGDSSSSSLDMLSRLKGIETMMAIAANVVLKSPLDMLSRLKGIETPITPLKSTPFLLWICFPVWRELKLR